MAGSTPAMTLSQALRRAGVDHRYDAHGRLTRTHHCGHPMGDTTPGVYRCTRCHISIQRASIDARTPDPRAQRLWIITQPQGGHLNP